MTIKAGVIGYPVTHSLSPKLHGFWLKTYGIDGQYIAVEAAPDQLEAVIKSYIRQGYTGFNITVPHKETVMAYLDDISDIARRIGAVNTIKVREDGSLYGTNTDAFGFIENLRRNAECVFSAGHAVVLGAGGAARAVCAGLLDAGVPQIMLTNRTRAKAEAIARDIGGHISVHDWDSRHTLLNDCHIVVNSTVLGMDGQRPLELSLEALPKNAIVTDIVYKPLITPLLSDARARGNSIVDGLGMLLYQAVPGFEMWFGRRPEVSPLQRDMVLGTSPDKEAGGAA